ncbi:MAG: hydrogenase maturation protease [Jatrophihabitantaceae bacterium]
MTSGQPVTGNRPVVIGIGNRYRRDDAVGLAVLDRLLEQRPAGAELAAADGDPARLIELWDGARLAIVVDAVRCQGPVPGRIHRGDGQDLDQPAGAATSHTLGVTDALRLAEVLGRAPGRLIVYAIEAAELGLGLGLSPAVAAAVEPVVAAIRRDLALLDQQCSA